MKQVTVQISEEDLNNYLLLYGSYSEEEREELNLDDEVVEVVNGILQNYFSDFNVIGKNTIELTKF